MWEATASRSLVCVCAMLLSQAYPGHHDNDDNKRTRYARRGVHAVVVVARLPPPTRISVARRHHPRADALGSREKHPRVRNIAPTEDPKSCHRKELELLG